MNLEGCEFSNCDFEHVLFEEVTFRHSSLADVTLSGALHTVLLDGCEFENFDFSASSFRELTFLDATIGSGFLPPSTNDGFVLLELADLDRWIKAVETRLGPEAASFLQADLVFLRSTGLPICIDSGSFEEVPEGGRRSVMAIGKSLADEYAFNKQI